MEFTTAQRRSGAVAPSCPRRDGIQVIPRGKRPPPPPGTRRAVREDPETSRGRDSGDGRGSWSNGSMAPPPSGAAAGCSRWVEACARRSGAPRSEHGSRRARPRPVRSSPTTAGPVSGRSSCGSGRNCCSPGARSPSAPGRAARRPQGACSRSRGTSRRTRTPRSSTRSSRRGAGPPHVGLRRLPATSCPRRASDSE